MSRAKLEKEKIKMNCRLEYTSNSRRFQDYCKINLIFIFDAENAAQNQSSDDCFQ